MKKCLFYAGLLPFFGLWMAIGVPLSAFEVVDTDFGQSSGALQSSVTRFLLSASEAEAPRQFNEVVVFTAKPETAARYVGIAFAHEDFSRIHLFAKQAKGVYYFLQPLKGDELFLDYRLIVDGVWLSDEHQPIQYNDAYGHEISRFRVEKEELVPHFGALPLQNREFLFRYQGGEGNRVYLNSDIGSWDPFRYRMAEVNPGVYEVTLHLTPGEHYYYFIENGQKSLGQLASNIRIHYTEGDVNSLVVK